MKNTNQNEISDNEKSDVEESARKLAIFTSNKLNSNFISKELVQDYKLEIITDYSFDKINEALQVKEDDELDRKNHLGNILSSEINKLNNKNEILEKNYYNMNNNKSKLCTSNDTDGILNTNKKSKKKQKKVSYTSQEEDESYTKKVLDKDNLKKIIMPTNPIYYKSKKSALNHKKEEEAQNNNKTKKIKKIYISNNKKKNRKFNMYKKELNRYENKVNLKEEEEKNKKEVKAKNNNNNNKINKHKHALKTSKPNNPKIGYNRNNQLKTKKNKEEERPYFTIEVTQTDDTIQILNFLNQMKVSKLKNKRKKNQQKDNLINSIKDKILNKNYSSSSSELLRNLHLENTQENQTQFIDKENSSSGLNLELLRKLH